MNSFFSTRMRGTSARSRVLIATAAALLLALATSGGASAAFPAGLAEPQLESPPTVTNVTPATSSAAGGVTVVIGGTNLTEATAVDFGSSSASFVVHSAIKIEAVVPPGSDGTVDVTVLTPAGRSATSTKDHFSYVPAGPSVLEVVPNEGSVEGGGKPVKVFGAHFVGVSAVHFGATNAPSFEVSGPEGLNVIPPEGVAPTEDITVTTPEGTSAVSPDDVYNYKNKLDQISGLSPNKGPAAGGNTVNISGENFYGVTGVKFGSTPALSFTVNSHGSITAVAPPGTADTELVSIESRFGPSTERFCKNGSCLVFHDLYKYDEPTVTGLSPSHGPRAGGTPVTITGTGFGIGKTQTEILFGKTPATSVECTTINSCTAVSPAVAKAKAEAIIVLISGAKTTKSKKNKAVEFSYE